MSFSEGLSKKLWKQQILDPQRVWRKWSPCCPRPPFSQDEGAVGSPSSLFQSGRSWDAFKGRSDIPEIDSELLFTESLLFSCLYHKMQMWALVSVFAETPNLHCILIWASWILMPLFICTIPCPVESVLYYLSTPGPSARSYNKYMFLWTCRDQQ